MLAATTADGSRSVTFRNRGAHESPMVAEMIVKANRIPKDNELLTLSSIGMTNANRAVTSRAKAMVNLGAVLRSSAATISCDHNLYMILPKKHAPGWLVNPATLKSHFISEEVRRYLFHQIPALVEVIIHTDPCECNKSMDYHPTRHHNFLPAAD